MPVGEEPQRTFELDFRHVASVRQRAAASSEVTSSSEVWRKSR